MRLWIERPPERSLWMTLSRTPVRAWARVARHAACRQRDATEPARGATWPSHRVPMQLHLDFTVPDTDALHANVDRAVSLGGRVLLDRSDDPEEPLFVVADPAGHPFCLFVA